MPKHRRESATTTKTRLEIAAAVVTLTTSTFGLIHVWRPDEPREPATKVVVVIQSATGNPSNCDGHPRQP